MASPTEYKNPFRPAYEATSAVAWASTALAGGFLGWPGGSLPAAPFEAVAGLAGAMALVRGVQAAAVIGRKRRLSRGRRFRASERFMQVSTLTERTRKRKDQTVWLGQGFEWAMPHTQLAHEIVKMDQREIKARGGVKGAAWIHGLERREEALRMPAGDLFGHLLILGTTRSGKTRLLDILSSQAIARGETVIMIDPKGDNELRENMRRACIAAGREDKFVWFHPAFPKTSVRLDPLYNFNRVTEVASRVAAVIPGGQGDGEQFRAFVQRALNAITNGLLIIGQRPSLQRLRWALEGGLPELVVEAVDTYCAKREAAWPGLRSKVPAATPVAQRATKYMELYRAHVAATNGDHDLEGLLSIWEHDRAHFSKMIASGLPILDMLTSGSLGALLSPDYGDAADTRPILDNKSIIANQMVLYVGLDSLSDPMVGSAIGSMYLADLASVAGNRYNYVGDLNPVNLFVDEAAESSNESMIQLLNKGGGAKFRVHVATQTIADFKAKLGSADKATQVLANENSWIALRVRDGETQEYLAESLPETKVKYIMRTQGASAKTSAMSFDANSGERLMEEDAPLIPAPIFGELPDLEFFGYLAGGKLIKGRIPILVE